MGALPKRKISTRRKGKRRQNHKIKLPPLCRCSYCKSFKIFRFLCPNCGKI